MKHSHFVFIAAILIASPASGQSYSDSWSAEIEWRDAAVPSRLVAPLHASLLSNNQVLFQGWPMDASGGHFVWTMDIDQALCVSNPPAVCVAAHSVPMLLQSDPLDHLFCGGQSFLSDGRFFAASGSRGGTGIGSWDGLDYALMHDWRATPPWQRIVAFMVGAPCLPFEAPALRWYPTAIRLDDGRMLVTAGIYDTDGPLYNDSVEAYDPISGSWQVVSSCSQTPPEIRVAFEDYPHVFQLPRVISDPAGKFDVLIVGAGGKPLFLEPEGNPLWLVRNNPRPGDPTPNHGASGIMLPIRLVETNYSNGSVLFAGGPHTNNFPTSPDHMVHFYDPVVDAWNPGLTQPICICNGRHHPSLKMAPTGEVLVINGDSLTHDPEIRRVVYIDPMNGFTVTKGKNTVIEERGYHNVAVLLPDGRFLVGSGAPGFLPGQERPTFRYYSPWYRQGQPQPVIQSAPSVIRYAQKFLIGFVSTAPTPVQAVLIAPTALTHSFDANQRYVELAVTVNPTGRITAVAPPDERVGPPGEYLLFLVDANRIPSVARWVRLR